jgi:hypothetical protein
MERVTTVFVERFGDSSETGSESYSRQAFEKFLSWSVLDFGFGKVG